jgi:hypothetical protein
VLSGGSAIAQVGDLFLLGPHRIICGDAADPDLVSRLMQTDVARMVLTDAPSPSPVAIAEQVAASDPPKDGIAAGHPDTRYLEFSRNWMNATLPHLVDGGLLGTFLDWRDLPLANAAATDLGLIPVDLIVWATANAAAGGLYRSDHGYCRFQEGFGGTRQQQFKGKPWSSSHQRLDLFWSPIECGCTRRSGAGETGFDA